MRKRRRLSGLGLECDCVIGPGVCLSGPRQTRAPTHESVHFKPQPQVVTRRMTIVTPGLSCCCNAPDEEARLPRRFWVLPGHGLPIRSVDVPFELERVELRCDPRAPQ